MITKLSRSAAAAMTSIPVAAYVMSAPMHARAMLNDTSFILKTEPFLIYCIVLSDLFCSEISVINADRVDITQQTI